MNYNIKDSRNPYLSNKIPNSLTTTITVGAEVGNVINVAVALKGSRKRALTAPTKVRLRLCADAAGLVLATPPTDGVYAGTNGTLIQGTDHLRDGVFQKGTLAIDAVPEKFKTTTTAYYRIKGIQYSKAAATAILFTAAHVVTASKFGIILIQVDAAGTVTTKVPGATQTTPMAYNTAPLALAALPRPDLGNIALGYIAIAAKAATWTANTDDLTNGSDLTTATFVNAVEQIGPSTFEVISNATGLFDINIKETGTPTFYLGVEFPGGLVKMSGPITFA